MNYDPLEWGWKLDENSLAPIMTTLDPSPSYLYQRVRLKTDDVQHQFALVANTD